MSSNVQLVSPQAQPDHFAAIQHYFPHIDLSPGMNFFPKKKPAKDIKK